MPEADVSAPGSAGSSGARRVHIRPLHVPVPAAHTRHEHPEAAADATDDDEPRPRKSRKTLEDFLLLDSDDSSLCESESDDDGPVPAPLPAPARDVPFRLPPPPQLPPPRWTYPTAVLEDGRPADIGDAHADAFGARIAELRAEQRHSLRREKWAFAQWKRLTGQLPHPAELRIARDQ